MMTEEEIIERFQKRLFGDFVDTRIGLAEEIRAAIKLIMATSMALKQLSEERARLLRELDELHTLLRAGYAEEGP